MSARNLNAQAKPDTIPRDGAVPDAHVIEDAVSVYLMRDPDDQDRWVVAPLALDGSPLFSTHEGYPSNDECACDDKATCNAVLTRMTQSGLPTGEELLHLLADALGYTLQPPA